ncbi:MAG: hypothetical protein AB1698_20670 [Pseudomonadota bacterium]
MFHRATFTNRAADERSCATCRFASTTVSDRHFSDTRPAQEIRCHRRPPVMNDSQDFFFPLVAASDHCSDWKADDGAERDENAAPLLSRCDLCRHSGPMAGTCRKNAPIAVTHEGKAVFPKVGPGQWCGDHEREAGVEHERFHGAVPSFLRSKPTVA